MEAKRKLTIKQDLFTDYIVRPGMDGTKAAIKAGYSKKTARNIATENLSKPYIREVVERKRADLARKTENETEVSFDWCMNLLKDGAKTAIGKQDMAALRGIVNEINKMLGYHAPEKKINLNTDYSDLLNSIGTYEQKS